MIAVIVQYKDQKGTILLLQPPSKKNQYVMEIVMKIETLVQSFTTFSSTLIHQLDQRQQILIAVPSYEKMHVPKVYLLNDQAGQVQQELVIEVSSIKKEEKKKQFAAKKSKSEQQQQQKKPELPLSGSISCMVFDNNNGFPELFVGYESGAIGCFRLHIENDKLQFKQVISIQKLIQDPNVHHVLSMNVINFKPGSGDFKLAIGYYAQVLQTIDFTLSSDNETYLIQSQKQSEQGCSEKPGIGCLSSLVIGNKGLLVSGSFDHRIRMISAKTMKLLVTLPFHQGIVNAVYIQKKSDQEVTIYAVSEDCYLSIWNLNI